MDRGGGGLRRTPASQVVSAHYGRNLIVRRIESILLTSKESGRKITPLTMKIPIVPERRRM